MKTCAADTHHAILIPITIEQLLAEAEERGIRQAVVFEDNRLVHDTEDPIHPGRHPAPAAEIDIRILPEHLARPVHRLDDRPRGPAARRLALAMPPRAV